MRAARACIERSRDEDGVVAAHAVMLLVDDAYGWLSRLAHADADEETAREVTDCIYAR